MRLIGAELRRLLGRSMFRVLTVLAVCIFVFIAVIAFVASDDDPDRVAAAAEERRVAIERCVESVPTMMDGEPQPEAVQDPEQYCRDQFYGSDPRFPYKDMQWIVSTLAVPMMMLGWLLGASFIGAEWANRTMMTTLTWEPRRIRVLAAKAVAVAIVAFAWIATLQVLFLALMYPAGAVVGDMRGVDAAWWWDTSGLVARAGLMATFAGIFGLSLATIGRNTAAALGAGFIYLAVIEGLIRAFRPSWVDWLIGDNAGVFLIGDLDVSHLGHSGAAAGLLLAAYAAGLFGLALTVFRRRDVA